MEVTAGMKELLTYIARNLVDHPDAVSVTEHKGESETFWSFGWPPRTWAR